MEDTHRAEHGLSKRRFLATAVAAATTGGLLAGCGPLRSGGGDGGVSAGGTPATIKLMVPSGTSNRQDWDDFVRQFQSLRPRIKVELEETAEGLGTKYDEKTLTLFAAGTPPDVQYVRDFLALHRQGPFFLDVTRYLDGESHTNRKWFHEGNWLRHLHGGKVFGLSHQFEFSWLQYRPSLFQRAGLGLPPTGATLWDWNQLLEAAKKLQRIGADGEPEVWGFGIRQFSDRWDYVLRTYGGAMYDWDKNVWTFAEPKAMQAWEWLQRLTQRERVLPKDGSTNFDGGKAAMIYGVTTVDVTEKALPGDWGVAALPKGPAGTVCWMWANSLAAARSTATPDAAWQVLRDLAIHAMGVRIAEVKSVSKQEPIYYLQSRFGALSGWRSIQETTANFIKKYGTGRPEAFGWPAYANAAKAIIAAVQRGDTPLSTLAEAQRVANNEQQQFLSTMRRLDR